MRTRALAALLMLAVSPALADDPTLTVPDVVVTATRVPTPLKDIPAGVTVIDRATIDSHGYNTLTDALRDVPGLHVSASGGPGGQASVFVRGANSNQVLVLRDGMPVTDAAEANGAYNFGIDTLSDIERIEIVRGPMAALYGSGAIGGVINLISRRGTEPGVHWSGDIAGGYPALIRGSVGVAGVQGPLDYAVTAESQSRQGYDSTPRRQSVYTDTAQGFRDRILTLNLGYTPIEGTRLSLFLRGQAAYFGFNSLGGFDALGNNLPTFDDANTNGKTTSLTGRVGGSTKLFNGALESALYAGQLQDDRRYQEPFQAADPNQASSDSRYHSYRTDVQWNNTLHLDELLPVPALSHSAFTFGYEYTGDNAKSRSTSNSLGGAYATASSGFMLDHAVHAGLQTTVLDRLAITGQVRQDWVVDQNPTTWRVGGVYDLKEIATHLKLSYGTGFRAPSLFDRYGVDVYGFVGNPNLRPERSSGWEAGFVTDVPAFSRVDFLSFGATYFDSRVRDLIETVFTPAFTEANVSSAHIHGIETEATLRPATWLDLHATYTLTDTTSSPQPLPFAPSLPRQLLRRPQNEASFDMTVKPLQGLRIVGTLIYTGLAHDYLYDNNSLPIGYGLGQHGLVADAAVTYAVMPRVDLYVNATNIFGSKFEAVNGYQTPGPTVLAGARIKL